MCGICGYVECEVVEVNIPQELIDEIKEFECKRKELCLKITEALNLDDYVVNVGDMECDNNTLFYDILETEEHIESKVIKIKKGGII